MRFLRQPLLTMAAVAALAVATMIPAFTAKAAPNPGPAERLLTGIYDAGRRAGIMTGIIQAGMADTNGVNCAVLRGSPFMCIKNQAAAPITDIQIVNMGGMMGNGWMNMGYFGGAIQPGGTTIVKFGTYGSGCQKILFVRLQSGSTHPFNLDVCANSSLVVQGW